jgi:hypothetical protein
MVHTGLSKVDIKQEVKPCMFLEYYVRKLETLRNSGVEVEVRTRSEYARLFLKEMLNQQLSVVMMMEREDIHELAGRLFKTHLTAVDVIDAATDAFAYDLKVKLTDKKHPHTAATTAIA